jgi:hypothetical protein
MPRAYHNVRNRSKFERTVSQKLTEEAALAGYHDLFFMFAALTLFSLLPVMLMRGDKPVLPVKAVKKE